MATKQNPFSLYDFLGYFTPGAIFMYSAAGIWVHLSDPNVAVELWRNLLELEKPGLYIPFVLGAYVCGHLLSFVSSITIERYSIWALGYPSKYLLGFNPTPYFSFGWKIIPRLILRMFVALAVLPISMLDLSLGKLLKFRKLYAVSLDPLLINLLKNKTEALIREKGGVINPAEYGPAAEHDYFRFVYHFAVEHSHNHLSKMQNYVALYGFLRTLALEAVILFWMLVWHAFSYDQHHVVIAMCFGSIVLSYLLFTAFVKFYRRFSLEAMMAMAVTFPGAEGRKAAEEDA